jgi:Caspase domain
MSNRLALLIGSCEFDDTLLARLATPAVDLQVVEGVLADPAIGKFTVAGRLFNESEARIRRMIDAFFQQARSDDVLLLYYTGHGVLDERGKLYLAARDTFRNALASTAVSAVFVSEAMDRSVARSQILVLDCCHSGAFAKGAKAALTVSVGTSSAFTRSGRCRAVLTATDATEYAWSGDEILGGGHPSRFTHDFVEGLKSGQADVDGDGRITMEDCYHWLRDRSQEEGGRQTPQLLGPTNAGGIVIGWTHKRHSLRAGNAAGAATAAVAARTPADTLVDLLEFPSEVRPPKNGLLRLSFGLGIAKARVIFRLNPDSLEITGKDKDKEHEGQFEHFFFDTTSRETRYELKVKSPGEERTEVVDVLVYDGEEQIFARSCRVSLRRESRWQSVKAQMTVGHWLTLSAILAAFLGGMLNTTKDWWTPAVFGGPALFQGTWNDTFENRAGGDWEKGSSWIRSGDANIANWPLSSRNALKLAGRASATMAPSVFGETWFRRGAVLQDCTMRIEFQFAENATSLGLLVHANPGPVIRTGYLFLLSLHGNPPPRGDQSHFELDSYEYKGGARRLILHQAAGKGAPLLSVVPKGEIFTLECTQKDKLYQLRLQRKSDRDPTKWYEFDHVSPSTAGELLTGGTGGLLTENGEGVYIRNWYVAGTGVPIAHEPAKP